MRQATVRDYTDPRGLTDIDKVKQSINKLMTERDKARDAYHKRRSSGRYGVKVESSTYGAT